MKVHVVRNSLLVGASLIAVSFASGAMAQDGGAGSSASQAGSADRFDEIIVTARKRDESLMDVPVAVTAIGAQQLERTGAVGLEQIAQLAPQVVVARAQTGAGATLSIRGLGTPFFDPGAENSVSVNIDGVTASRGNIITQGFFDLQQVEVLKGPQALFFGKNSPAGVISLRSVSPGDKLEGYVRAGYEFEARERYVEAAIGGPITESLKGRIAIRGSKMRGWLKNTATGLSPNPFYGVNTSDPSFKGNGGEDILGRVTLVYDAGSNFDATLKVSAGVHKDNGSTGQAVCAPEGGLTRPTTFGTPDPAGDCKFDGRYQQQSVPPGFIKNFTGGRDGVPYSDAKSLLGSLTMNYNFGNLTLTSVTGYFDLNYKNVSNFTFSSFGNSNSFAGEDTRQWSQELRLVSDYDGPLNFSFGGYYEDSKIGTLASAIFFLPIYDPVADTHQFYVYKSDIKSKSVSAFGQLRWNILEHLELSGGVRYSRDKKDVTQGQTYVNPPFDAALGGPFGFVGSAGLVSGKFKSNDWSPELTLSWKPNDDILVFGSYKTGYKAGGIGTPALLGQGQTLDSLAYKSEKIKGFEGGIKAELLDRTARIELTAYSYDYSDLQISVFDQAVFQFRLANAKSSRIKGLELAGQWRPVHGLSLNAAAAYNDAKYTDFPSYSCYTYQTVGCTAGKQSLTGRSLSRAPKWVINGGFSYDHDLGNGLGIGISADANYTSSYDAAEDKAPIMRQKSYTLINAGARLYSDEAGWDVSFVGRNLTNKYYKYLGHGKSGASAFEYVAYLPRTRELRVQVGYKF